MSQYLDPFIGDKQGAKSTKCCIAPSAQPDELTDLQCCFPAGTVPGTYEPESQTVTCTPEDKVRHAAV